MWFKKLFHVLTFLTVLVLCTVSGLVAPVAPKSETRPPAPADAPSLLAEANRLSWLDNWTAAGPLYDRAEALFRIAGDKRNEIFAHLGRIRAFGPAGSWERMSRALHQQSKNPIVKADRRLRLWCLALQGYVDVDLNIESAKRSWSEVLGIATGLGEQRWKARALGELGVIAFFEGNLTRAVRLVGDSVWSLAVGGDKAGVARLLTLAGYGFDPQRRFSEAKWFFSRAQALMHSTPDAGFPFGARIGYAEALAGEGDRSQARNLLYDALTKARFEKDSFHEADILIVLGEIASKTRELELAKLYFKQAATIAHRLKLYRTSALAMSDLASVYRIQGKFAHADATIQVALKADHHLGDRYYMPRDLTAAAELKIAENQPRQAELLFEEAEDLTDGVMRYQHADYGNAALSGAMSETYLQHFHLLQQEGRVARAFRLLERVRGRILATRMYEHRKAPTASPARETIEANIAAIQVKLMANEDPKARLALEDQLLQNERTLAVEDNKSSENWTLLRPASLTALQKVLRHDELLLEYVLDDPHAFCIAVTANDARIIQLPTGNKQIQDLTGSYLRELKARSSSQQLAADLYTILLKEATQAFHKARLIVAPDGILNFLPFEALRGADGRFVVNSTVVSYTPSATALWVLRTAKTALASQALLAIGDVEYANRRISRDSRSSQGWVSEVFGDPAELSSSQLQNLPESRQEVLSIVRIAGENSKVLLGRDATETALKAQRLSQYRVVHLAVHAIADSQYPDRSALVLAVDSPPEDGLLQVREITRLHLNADIVTLSACQTGVGPTEGEAGVISLEQAFLMAGAKAVVASLWNVEDQSTTVLMEAFYRHLAEHEDKAAALAHAKRDFLEQNRNLSAFYWAGFVIVGEGAVTVSLRN